MRPPEFTGGNVIIFVGFSSKRFAASMRPPEFTGGNVLSPAAGARA